MRLCEREDFPELIGQVADDRGINPAIVEKDYYEALRIIATGFGDVVLFKGGTSLSKGWKPHTLCGALLGQWPTLWRCLKVEGGDPTNNHAENALRLAVLWRNSSFGHRDEAGEQFVERMLTAVTTLWLQGRNLWHYLVETCVATRHGTSAPSLLPRQPFEWLLLPALRSSPNRRNCYG